MESLSHNGLVSDLLRYCNAEMGNLLESNRSLCLGRIMPGHYELVHVDICEAAASCCSNSFQIELDPSKPRCDPYD